MLYQINTVSGKLNGPSNVMVINILCCFFAFFAVFAEKRPLKFQVPNTYYRNPTSRLLHRDYIDSRHQHQQNAHLYHHDRSSSSNLGTMVGGNNEVVYTFRPSKQLVSNIYFYLLRFRNKNMV